MPLLMLFHISHFSNYSYFYKDFFILWWWFVLTTIIFHISFNICSIFLYKYFSYFFVGVCPSCWTKHVTFQIRLFTCGWRWKRQHTLLVEIYVSGALLRRIVTWERASQYCAHIQISLEVFGTLPYCDTFLQLIFWAKKTH